MGRRLRYYPCFEVGGDKRVAVLYGNDGFPYAVQRWQLDPVTLMELYYYPWPIR